MSVVARQSFKYSLVGYLGFLLGTLSTFFLFTNDLSFYGKLRFILPTAQLFLPIAVFGISYSNVKFFQEMQKDGKHHNMLSVSLLGIVFNFILFCICFFCFYLLFPNYQNSKTWEMKGLILPLVLVSALSAVFNKYISNYKRIAISNIFENLFPKLANIGAFCLFFFLGFSESWAYLFFFLVFLSALLGYYYYANKLESINFDFSLDYFKENSRWKPFLDYSFYGFLGNLGSYLALSIDNYMISEHIGFQQNGVYSTIYSIISLVSVPAMGLYSISAPIINKHFAEGTMAELNHYHKKTSLVLFSIGLVLLCCICVGFPYLTFYMPKSGGAIREAQSLVWIIGAATLFELATGFNGYIISMSKYYRFSIIVMLVLAMVTIGLNFFFIKFTNLGILGVGIAYAVSLTLFNIVKIIFNYIKFKVFPLSMPMLYVLIVGGIALGGAFFLPELNIPFYNLVYKPFVVLIIALLGNHFLKIYPLADFVFEKLKKKK